MKITWWIVGYKAATKTYSEEDLRKAFYQGREVDRLNEYKQIIFKYPTFNGWLREQSFNQPPIPVAFKAEMIDCDPSECTSTCSTKCQNPKIKTTPNEQGIPVWQGEYIFK